MGWAATFNSLVGNSVWRVYITQAIRCLRQPLTALSETAYGLGNVHALLVACMHRLAHASDGSSGKLIWLYDIKLLAGIFSELEWRGLIDLAQQRQQATAVLDGLALSREYLDAVFPEWVETALVQAAEQESFQVKDAGNKLKVEWFNFKSLPSWKQRVAFLRQHLFPPAAYMRGKYSEQRAWMLPLLYLKRLFGGLVRRSRRF